MTTYTPSRTVAYEQMVALCASRAAAHHAIGAPLRDAVSLQIVAVLRRPKRLHRRSDPRGRIACAVRPDLDNVVKAVLDGLVRGGVLVDDRIVVQIHAEKWYAAVEEGPCCEITVEKTC